MKQNKIMTWRGEHMVPRETKKYHLHIKERITEYAGWIAQYKRWLFLVV